MNRCTHCNKLIVLVPSAAERAKRYGGQPSDYTHLFTIHADCQIAKRNEDATALMRRLNPAPD